MCRRRRRPTAAAAARRAKPRALPAKQRWRWWSPVGVHDPAALTSSPPIPPACLCNSTLCTAAANLKANGARRVFAFASHGLFSGTASDRIQHSVLEEVVVTNTIPLKPIARANDKIVQLSVAPLLSEAIKRVHLRQSVSALFTQARKKSAAD